jgi:hypothetical protein
MWHTSIEKSGRGLLLVAGFVVTGAARGEVACGDWFAVETPSPGAYSGLLHSIAAHGSDDALAVGFYAESDATARQPLVIAWDGNSWSAMSLPSISGLGTNPVLRGVGATPNGDFWVAGYVTTGYPTNNMPLLMRRDAGGWTDVSTPSLRPQREYPYGPRGGFGEAVLALDENDVWVVGVANGYGDATSSSVAMALNWDGSGWTDTEVPIVGNRHNSLNAVSGAARDDVWAVGEWRHISGAFEALIQHWDGSSWSHVPNPAEAIPQTFLDDVAAAAWNDVWAIGSINYSEPLMMHYDGNSWSIVSGPPGGTAITAAGPGDVWVADASWSFYYHWNGASWTPVAAPPTTPGAWFDAIYDMTTMGSCDVWAAGASYYDTSIESRTLAQRLVGGSTTAGDVDGDGDVDISDLALLLSAFGACSGDPSFDAAADFNGSGCVELSDLAVLLANFGM